MFFRMKYQAMLWLWERPQLSTAGGLPLAIGVSYGKILHGQNQTLQFLSCRYGRRLEAAIV